MPNPNPAPPLDPDEYAELGTRLAEGADIVATMQQLRTKLARFMGRLDAADETVTVFFGVHEELDCALHEISTLFGVPRLYGQAPLTVVA